MGRSEGAGIQPRRRIAGAAGLLALAGAASAAGDGRALYASCVACHAARGEGVVATGAPAIGGLGAGYLARQLKAFAAGARGSQPGDSFGAAMRGAGSVLTDDAQRAAVAGYIASLPRAHAAGRATDNPNGRNYFNALCSSCHGSDGAGNESLGAPRLSGLTAVYIERQLVAFTSGPRGAQAGDKEGGQMRSIAKLLPDAATARDVAAYAAALNP